MTAKLKIGSGIARARRNRSRPGRYSSDVACRECGQPLAKVAACTCIRSRPLVLRKQTVKRSALRTQRSASPS
jgi:hypothetical protein